MWKEVEELYRTFPPMIERIACRAEKVGIFPSNGWLKRCIGFGPSAIKAMGTGRSGDPVVVLANLTMIRDRLRELETDLELLEASEDGGDPDDPPQRERASHQARRRHGHEPEL